VGASQVGGFVRMLGFEFGDDLVDAGAGDVSDGAVTVFVCQIGLRIFRMSSVSISSNCFLPIKGSAYWAMVAYHWAPCFSLRHSAFLLSIQLLAKLLKVGQVTGSADLSIGAAGFHWAKGRGPPD
jgi:hypothetical protein